MASKRKAGPKRPAARAAQQKIVGADAPQVPLPVPPSRSPERTKLAAVDFYSALQRTLDATQRKLSSANNAFADFVVKEFKVDAAVQLNINELGVLQLMLADDAMNPQSVSRVSLTLAAVAKVPDVAPPKIVAAADAIALADLTWLPPQLATQLAQYEIKTASEFLGLVADARFTTQVASLLKLARADLGRWSNQIRLLGLPGMTVDAVGVLGKLEIYAVADLAQLSDESIADLQKKASKSFTSEMLVKWRDAAKAALP